LDTDERRRFAQISHEYLIEQLQFTGDESVTGTTNKLKLSFNHPCKELIWVVQKDSVVDATTTATYGGQQWFNYTDKLDSTYFSGTPSDPLGGGIGTAAFTGGQSFPYSLPFSSVYSGVPNSGATAALGVTNFSALTFQSLLTGGVNTAALGANAGTAWASGAPIMDGGANPVASGKLQLNGHDRFYEREGRYFNLVQPFQHHENVPATGINVYSFALKPEEHQPSGTCNFSRIDNATLQLTLTAATTASSSTAKVRVYATNYNVLRIMSGMGGLAYSN
jgi:hypothetical protein